jgi:hypothetical protein
VNLIARDLTTMVNSEDCGSLQSKRKAITALLPYVIQQERDGQLAMLDVFLRAARASKEWEFAWHRLRKYASPLLREASPRAVVLVLPYIRWDWLGYYREDWIQRWAWAVSGAPDTERVAQSVVDTLLQIASEEELLPHIPVSIWSWLTKRPHLPAICLGRNVGTCAHVVKAVRGLRDVEILKSYFLLVWSEWNHFSPDGFNTLSRYLSDSPDSVPSSPPLYAIPTDTSNHYLSREFNTPILQPLMVLPPSPPTPILQRSILRPPIPQPSILDLPPIPVSMPTHHSSSSPSSTLSRHMHSGSDSVLDRCPPLPDSTPSRHPAYVADGMSSRRTSISSNSTPGPPLHPISTQIPQPLMQLPLLAQPPPITLPFHVVRPSTPSVIQDSRWIAQPLTRPPPIGPPVLPYNLVMPDTPSDRMRMRNIQDSRSDLRPPHIPNNIPNSHSSGGFYEMQISIQQDFGGIGMEHHRADLLQRLDDVIRRLDRGLEYLKQHDPAFNEAYLQRTKHQYQYLRDILLEMNTKSKQSYVTSNDHVPRMHAEPRATFMCALPLPCP